MRTHDDQWSAAEVRSVQNGNWAVSRFEKGAAVGPPPADLVRTFGRPDARFAWLMPDTAVRTAVLSTPPLKGKALDRAVRGMAARDENGVPEDWKVSWQTWSSPSGDGKRDVFALYAARDQIESQLTTAADWGGRPDLMLPGFMALELFYRRYGPESGEHSAWNLVFVGKDEQFLCVSTEHSLLIMRNLPEDLSAGHDRNEYLGRLTTEIERSVFFAKQTEYSPQVERIIVCGDADLAAGLVTQLQQQDLVPAVHWDLEHSFDWGGHAHVPDDLLTAVGAAMAAEGSPLNLLGQPGQTLLTPQVRRRGLVAAGACAVALVPLLLAGGVLTAQTQRGYLHKARERLAETRIRADRAADAYRTQRVLLARETHISRFASERPDLESVLYRLAALTPAQVVFRDLQVREEPDGRFVLFLQGESQAPSGAEAQAALLEFLTGLRKSDFLTVPAEPTQMTIKPWDDAGAGGYRSVFSLDLELKQPHPAEGA